MTKDNNDKNISHEGNNLPLSPKKHKLRNSSLERKTNYIFKRKYKRIKKSNDNSNDDKNKIYKSSKNKDQMASHPIQKTNRGNRLPRIKVIFSTANWFLPKNINEANSLNDKVTFFYSSNFQSSTTRKYDIENENDNCNGESANKTFANNIRIKYDPKKFLNINKLLNTSQKEYLIEKDTEQTTLGVDFDLETFLNKDNSFQLDSLEIPFKSLYPLKKKNYFHASPLTIPSIEDRKIFHRLLEQSKCSSFINSNITVTFP